MYVWPSIHLSAWNNSSPTGGILMMFYIWEFFEDLLRKFRYH
jgi:hypothetical protein